MGYRSDVRAHIYPYRVAGDPDSSVTVADEYARLKVIMNTTYRDFMEYWGEHFNWNESKQFLDFSMGSVKWYEDHPEIQKFMEVLKELEDLEFQYEFIRMGEEIDDIDRQASDESDWLLEVRREIISDWD